MSLLILLGWSGLLSLTCGRLTTALGGPAAVPGVRFAGGVALAAALLVVHRALAADRDAPADRAWWRLACATVLPGLLLLQLPLAAVSRGLALLWPAVAGAPEGAARLVLAELVWGWLLVGLALAVAAQLPRLAGPGRWRQLAWGLAAVYGTLGVWTAQIQTLTGDEPHYLLAARSLIRDGDADLTNDYGDELWREFYPSDALRRALPGLAPVLDPHAVPGRQGEVRPVHQLGFSLLLAPGYAVAGAAGARFVAVLLATLAGWLAVRLAVEVAGAAGWAGGLLVALLSPLVALGPTLHAEPAAVACLTFLAWQAARPGRGPRALAVAALATGGLVWLHLKLLPTGLVLVLWLTRQSRRAGERTWWGPGAGLLAGLASQLAIFAVMYGSGRPDAPQLAGAGKFPTALGGAWSSALPGLFFDQQDGLFMAWPVGLLLGVGLVRGWPRAATRWLAAAVAVHVALIATYPLWRSGFAPAGRQLLPILGLLGGFAGLGWQATCRSWGRRRPAPAVAGPGGPAGRDGAVDDERAVPGGPARRGGTVLRQWLVAVNVTLVAGLAWLPRLRYPYEALDGFRRAPWLARLPLPGADVLLPALDTGARAVAMAWIYLLVWALVSARAGRRSQG